MALFGRKDDRAKQDKATAKALAMRGVSGEAMIERMRETGEARADGIAREIEFELSFTPEGSGRIKVTHRQLMNDLSLTGLAAGEPAEILYDSDNPETLIVRKSTKYTFVSTSSGPVAVPVAEAEARGIEPG